MVVGNLPFSGEFASFPIDQHGILLVATSSTQSAHEGQAKKKKVAGKKGSRVQFLVCV